VEDRQYGDALRGERADQFERGLPVRRVQRRHRLVQQQQPWRGDGAGGQVDPLPLTAGQHPAVHVPQRLVQVQPAQRRRGGIPRRRGIQTAAPCRRGRDAEGAGAGRRRKELRHVAEVATAQAGHRAVRQAGQLGPPVGGVQPYRTGVRQVHPVDAAQQRRLAGAAGPGEGDVFTGVHVDVDAA
jgi:hypothetical protein